jgi:hypothetical protein
MPRRILESVSSEVSCLLEWLNAFKRRLWHSRVFILAFFASLTLWSFIPIVMKGSPTIHVDEAYFFYIAGLSAESGFLQTQLPAYGSSWVYPPVIPMIFTGFAFLISPLNLGIIDWIIMMEVFKHFMESIMIFLAGYLLYRLMRSIGFKQTESYFGMFAFIASPIIAYRLFYVHATYIANFLGIFFILYALFLLSENRGRGDIKSVLLLGMAFSGIVLSHTFSALAFTLAFFLPFALLSRKEDIWKAFPTLIGSIAVSLAICLPFLLHLVFYGGDVGIGAINEGGSPDTSLIYTGVNWHNAHSMLRLDFFIQILFPLALPLSAGAVLASFKKKDKKIIFPVLSLVLLVALSYSWLIGGFSVIGNYRYPTFMIIPFSLLTGVFLHRVWLFISTKKKRSGKTIFLIVCVSLILIGATYASGIVSAYQPDELGDLKELVEENGITGTIMTDPRFAPWIPLLIPEGKIAFAMTQIINPNESAMKSVWDMISPNVGTELKYNISKELSIDYVILNKNFGVVDGIRYKGFKDNVISTYAAPYFELVEESDNWIIFRPVI